MTEGVLSFDVLIIGAGPAGLSAAIHLKKISPQITVCVLEKGKAVGSHILSGLVFEPTALEQLIPDWQNKNFPLIPCTSHHFSILTQKKMWSLPHFLLPSELNNLNNYVGSLGVFCQWLADIAVNLGVEIFPGFAAAKLLFDDGKVTGVETGEKGLTKYGQQTPEYQPGVKIQAKYTLLAEGCRGHLTEQVIRHFNLRNHASPQTYGLGIKEIWEVNAKQHHLGKVSHFLGWPLTHECYGGGFIYHLPHKQIAVGLVVGLDYRNPYLDPFEEMQRFKTHPALRPLFMDGKRIAYGARALNEGGFQSIPDLIFPGGALIGCAAGFLNVPKIKGTHNAMKTGMLAAETIVEALEKDPQGGQGLENYFNRLKHSLVYKELHKVRNVKLYFRFGFWPGIILSGIDLKIFHGKAPWTLHSAKQDREQMALAKSYQEMTYPLPDGKITFNKSSSVYLANIAYRENQPEHLVLQNPLKSLEISFKLYAAPEQRYCPAGVYEILFQQGDQPKLVVHSGNCIHCKTCDIKDPADNIQWMAPEGGSGPNYQDM